MDQAKDVLRWRLRYGGSMKSILFICTGNIFRSLVAEWVEQVNAELAQVEQIKKFRMLPKELDHEDGELTATQKVKRSAIAKLFERNDLVLDAEQIYDLAAAL